MFQGNLEKCPAIVWPTHPNNGVNPKSTVNRSLAPFRFVLVVIKIKEHNLVVRETNIFRWINAVTRSDRI